MAAEEEEDTEAVAVAGPAEGVEVEEMGASSAGRRVTSPGSVPRVVEEGGEGEAMVVEVVVGEVEEGGTVSTGTPGASSGGSTGPVRGSRYTSFLQPSLSPYLHLSFSSLPPFLPSLPPQPFSKNFYTPSSAVTHRPMVEVETFRQQKEITIVQGQQYIGNPITNFEEGGFPEYLLK